MKCKAITLLLIFISFIAAPTVLSKIYSDIDVSAAYTLAEEEEETHSGCSEIQLEITSHHIEPVSFYEGDELGRIIWKYLLKHDNASTEIFSPPPEFFLV